VCNQNREKLMKHFKALMTTSWDDGHPADLRIANLLKKYNLDGTFYVPLRSQRNLVSPPEMRSLAAEFEIGGHTINHVSLTTISDAVAWEEISGCRPIIEDIVGLPCLMFCFPNGRYARRHVSMVHQAGYRGCRTVELLSFTPRVIAGIPVLATTIQAFPHPSASYIKNALKRMAFPAIGRCFRYRPGRGWIRLAAAMLEVVCIHGGVFHLWGHSWEIDQCEAWGELEKVLSMMAQFHGQISPVSNSVVCSSFYPMSNGTAVICQ
jgi:peptidoglycan/xylan/chitin deacetylase (PgdA/CDA1 family)